MQELPPVLLLPPGSRVRVRFGRYSGRTGVITDEQALLPAMEPLVWVSLDGGTEQGLIAVRFLDPVR